MPIVVFQATATGTACQPGREVELRLFPPLQRREDCNREGYKGDNDASRCAARDPVMGKRWKELEVGFVLKVDEEGFRGVGESVDLLVGSGDGESVDFDRETSK